MIWELLNFDSYRPVVMRKPYTKILKICKGNVKLASVISNILKGNKSQEIMIRFSK